jgi:Putative homoserine kinase type II (protein kinase fold)
MFSEEIALLFAKKYTSDITSAELLGVSHNTVYKINCKNPFILRITSGNHRSKEEIIGEIDFLTFLSNNGVNVAIPIPTLSDDMIAEHDLENGIVLAVAFTIADGMQWEEQERVDRDYIEYIGRELGRIHKCSQTYIVDKGHSRRQYNENQHLKKAYDIFENYNSDLSKAYKQLMEQLPQTSRTKANFGLTHGDFMFSNYTLTKDNKVTVYDFDECEYSWFISDIATFLYFHLISAEPSKTAIKIDGAEEVIVNFMLGYLTENDLPLEGLKLLDIFFKLREYTLLSSILENEKSFGQWGELLIPVALKRLITYKPFVDVDLNLIINKIKCRLSEPAVL